MSSAHSDKVENISASETPILIDQSYYNFWGPEMVAGLTEAV